MLRLSTAGRAVDGEDVWTAVLRQRATTVGLARALDETELAGPTRCPDWPVRDLLTHLCDTTGIFDRRVDGVDRHRFDPIDEPNTLIAEHGEERAGTVVADLDRTSGRYVERIEQLLDARDARQVDWLYANPVDWQLLAVHAFWDEWVHERDLWIPREPQHRSNDEETRLAAAYGLMLCGLGLVTSGTDLVYETTLGGIGGGTFRLETTDGEITVTATASSDAGGVAAADAVDSMAGRGPLPVDALEGDAETLALLSVVGRFMRGDFSTG